MTHPYFRLVVATLSLLSLADVHGQCHADLNGNHMVDNHDLLILLADYGQTCEDADGDGASLEWLGLPHNNALSTSWVASSALGGSPGLPNSTWAD